MFCTNCGKELKEGAMFCVKCGKAVNAQMNSEKVPSDESGRKKNLLLLIAVVLIVVALIVGGCIFLNKDDDAGANINVEENDDDDDEQNLDNEATEDDENLPEDTETVVETQVVSVLGDDSVNPMEIHTYEIVMADVMWTEAFEASKNIPNGYLVHINSPEEMQVILAQIQAEGHDDAIFWIGARRDEESLEYHWIDSQGKPVGECINDNAYWLAGEPTWTDADTGAAEDSVAMFYTSKTGSWVWNDTVNYILGVLPSYTGKIGYIIEVENP